MTKKKKNLSPWNLSFEWCKIIIEVTRHSLASLVDEHKNVVVIVSLTTSTFNNICSKEQIKVLYYFDDCYLMPAKKKMLDSSSSSHWDKQLRRNTFVSFLQSLFVTQADWWGHSSVSYTILLTLIIFPLATRNSL